MKDIEIVKEAISGTFTAPGMSRITARDLLNAEFIGAMSEAVLAALSASGLVIVPRIPTEEMVEAGHEVISRVYVSGDECPDADDAYRAMLSAHKDESCEPVTITDEFDTTALSEGGE